MKLGRIVVSTPDGEQLRTVAVEPENDRVIDLARAYALVLQRRGATAERARELALSTFPASLSNAISIGDAFLDIAHDALAAADDASTAIADVQWRAAIDPPVIRDGLTFGTHIENYFKNVAKTKPVRAVYERPGYFKGTTSTVFGHDQVVPYPNISEKLDYELEIGYIMGKPGRNLTPDDAMDHIFGITIFNDWSLRDVQALEGPIGRGLNSIRTSPTVSSHGSPRWVRSIRSRGSKARFVSTEKSVRTPVLKILSTPPKGSSHTSRSSMVYNREISSVLGRWALAAASKLAASLSPATSSS